MQEIEVLLDSNVEAIAFGSSGQERLYYRTISWRSTGVEHKIWVQVQLSMLNIWEVSKKSLRFLGVFSHEYNALD